jgi:hypothetical protein
MKRPDAILCRGKMSTVLTANTKKRKYSRTSLDAADRLLKAVKDKIVRERGKVDYTVLRRQGYSEETIARLKEL